MYIFNKKNRKKKLSAKNSKNLSDDLCKFSYFSNYHRTKPLKQQNKKSKLENISR